MSERAAVSSDPAAGERSRRGWLALAGASAGALALAGCGSVNPRTTAAGTSGAAPPTSQANFGEGDVGTLNFALQLEYLQANLYDQIVSSGVAKGADAALFQLIQGQEHQHIEALQRGIRQLNGTPIDPPQTNFQVSDGNQALKTAADLEQTVAAAYLGQIPQVIDQGALALFLSIHTVEGRHAGELGRRAGQSLTPDGPFGSPLGRSDVRFRVNAFIT